MKINLKPNSIEISCIINNWEQADWLYRWIESNGALLFGPREKKNAVILKLIKTDDVVKE